MNDSTAIRIFVRTFLAQHPSAWVRPWAGEPVIWVGPRPTTEEIANDLLAGAEAEALDIGAWLTTPDGALIAEGVSLVIPPYYAEDFTLLVDGLKLAAKMQRRIGQRRAGAFALLIAAAVLALLTFGN